MVPPQIKHKPVNAGVAASWIQRNSPSTLNYRVKNGNMCSCGNASSTSKKTAKLDTLCLRAR